MSSYADVLAAVDAARSRIAQGFEQVVESDDSDVESPVALAPAWVSAVEEFKGGLSHLDDTSRLRLMTFLEVVGGEIAERSDLEALTPRILALAGRVARRSAYLALLNESSGARELLYRLLGVSAWIGDQLCAMPALLDELLDIRQLLAPPDRQAIDDELVARLDRVDDEETRFNRLREFKAAHVLRTAATELLGERLINHASDHLTWVAESILRMACQQAHRHVQARHGCPLDANGQRTDQGIGIIGYGKLGGIELSYGSDLDLVFVHCVDERTETDGDKPISGQQYLQRWVRHFLQILNVRTTSGVLYEIDTRLRPSGSKGLMVVSLSGYQKYLESEAWTWERQALVRARPIAGDPDALDQFAQIRQAVLRHARDSQALKRDVIEMREKMRNHLSQTDIKHASGGVVDLEFIVQYLTLRDAPSCPALTQWSDNLRLLETLAAHKAMPDSQARALIDAYLSLRTAQHRQALAAPIDMEALTAAKDTVRSAWKQWLGDNNTNEA